MIGEHTGERSTDAHHAKVIGPGPFRLSPAGYLSVVEGGSALEHGPKAII